MKRYAITTQPASLLGGQKREVWAAVQRAGAKGATRLELSAKINMSPDRIGFYLSELKRSGHVQIVGTPVDPVLLSASDAALYALHALETALVAKAKEKGVTTEMEKGFALHQKLKGMVLRPGTEAEGQVARRTALVNLVKLVY